MQPETTYHAILGQTLKELRKNKGMDQSEMAKRMNINRPSWSKIENGGMIANIQQLNKAAEIFDIEVNEILLKVDVIANSLKEKGYIVHYDTVEKIRSKSSGSQGMALIGGAVLGLLIGGILFGSNESNDSKNKNSNDENKQ